MAVGRRWAAIGKIPQRGSKALQASASTWRCSGLSGKASRRTIPDHKPSFGFNMRIKSDRDQGCRSSGVKVDEIRFVNLPELCGRWTVWDREARMPAMFGGDVCTGLSKNAAEEMNKILVEIHGTSIRWSFSG